jgi:catechol 2,3-dioxygenase-like lactoylglutathione lyase family enzyme
MNIKIVGCLLAVGAIICSKKSFAQTADVNPLQLAPHHVTASVADIDKESEWYQRVLGFREIARENNGTDFALRQMGIPGYRIDLRWSKGTVRPAREGVQPGQGWFHVVFKTPKIEAVLQKLTDEKTDVKAYKNGQALITRMVVHDPEGNEVEIVPAEGE